MSLAAGDLLPLPSLLYTDEPSLIPRKTLTVFMAAESIPEPTLLLILGATLLGVAGLIHMSKAHNRRLLSQETER